jgi:hypothetical protein
MRALLQLGRDIIVSCLARLSTRGAVAVIDGKEVGIITEILKHAASILALLLLRS